MRKVVPGSASKSYGIEVARLAGLLRSVVERARDSDKFGAERTDVTGKPKFARHLKKLSSRQDQLSLLDALSDAETDESPQSHGDRELGEKREERQGDVGAILSPSLVSPSFFSLCLRWLCGNLSDRQVK